LQQDLKDGRHDRMVFYIFDLLHLDGADLTSLPFSKRKEALAGLLSGLPERGALRLSESLTGSGTALLRHACKIGLEGIVSKLANAPYNSGVLMNGSRPNARTVRNSSLRAWYPRQLTHAPSARWCSVSMMAMSSNTQGAPERVLHTKWRARF